MKAIYKISLILNAIIILVFAYFAFNFKDIAKEFISKNIIEVRHEQKLSMFRATPVKNGAIIFLGNSITEGGNWRELFDNNNILNRGIGGDITEGVLNRLDEIVRHQPSKLFICIGTNDLARDIQNDSILKNYQSILEIVQKESPNTQIYVQSILPVGESVIFQHSNDKIIPLNQEIKSLCSKFNVEYIDLYEDFTDENGHLNPSFTNDNLHLLGAGYQFWKSKIIHYVNE